MTTVRVRLPAMVSQEEAKRIIKDRVAQLVRALVTDASSDPDAERAVNAAGISLLNTIKREFVVKSRGGTDSAGIKWKPLSKKYLAYGRRFGPGEQAKLRKAAGVGKGHRHGIGGNTGLLTASEKKLWTAIFASTMFRLIRKGIPESQAKSQAAKAAWSVLKSRGAKTKLEVYGNRKVEIMRDTGTLFNSLDVRLTPGGFEVYSDVVYAARALSMRPAWPDSGTLPESWTQPMLDAMVSSIRSSLSLSISESVK
jgi:hypothetical protein